MVDNPQTTQFDFKKIVKIQNTIKLEPWTQ